MTALACSSSMCQIKRNEYSRLLQTQCILFSGLYLANGGGGWGGGLRMRDEGDKIFDKEIAVFFHFTHVHSSFKYDAIGLSFCCQHLCKVAHKMYTMHKMM